MNQESHSAETLRRLLAVDWKGDFETELRHARSRAKLMREYLRRAAQWAQALDATNRWPFFDIAEHVAPDVQPPADFSEQLETLISTSVGWPSVDTTCRAALHWASLLDANTPLPSNLGDPYEPLLLLLGRGGAWTTESGFIDLGASSVLRKTWRDHLSPEPVTTLDQATLDALDEQTS